MIQAIAYRFRKDMQDTLSYLLSQTYIIRELLQDLDQDTIDEFVDKYVESSSGKGVKEIPVIFGYPQDLKDLDGLIAVSAGAGQEDNQSLGFHEGNIYEGRGEIVKEILTLTNESSFELYGTLNHEILSIESIEEITEVGIRFQDNKIYIDSNYYPSLDVWDKLTVVYSAKKDSLVGVQSGFSAKEEVLISILSANEATIVCMDILVKACVITLRESLRDRLMTDLPKLSYTPIQPMSPELVPDTPNIIFNRDYALVYTISHNMDKINTKVLDSIKVNGTPRR